MSAQIIQTMAFTQIMVILTSPGSVEDHLKNFSTTGICCGPAMTTGHSC